MKNGTELGLTMAVIAGCAAAVILPVLWIEAESAALAAEDEPDHITGTPAVEETEKEHGEWMETQIVRSQAREALRREPEMPAERRGELLKIANEKTNQ